MEVTLLNSNEATNQDHNQGQPDRVPEALKERNQWVVWRWAERDRARAKVPFDPHTRRNVNHTDPRNWLMYSEAVALVGRQEAAGVGFCLSEDDPFFAIDIDRCRNPRAGELTEDARLVVERFSSTYAEVSVSGTGIHVIGIGTLPPGARRGAGLPECYDRRRFIAITGDTLNHNPVTDCSHELERWYRETYP